MKVVNFERGTIFLLMLSGPLVTTAWRVLRLQMKETASGYGG
jgi:hypothetical protein